MKGRLAVVLLLACGWGGLGPGLGQGWAQDVHVLLTTLLSNEQGASAHRGRYTYMSEERSDRTGGHLWTERVVETPQGRVRLLLAEDGQPLSPQRAAAERARLAQDAAHPEAFAQKEAAQQNDEQHARAMLALLPNAYLFEAPQMDGELVKIRFRPNPSYQPQSMEERVLHGMTGTVTIDRPMMRLRELDGHMDSDVSLGFGPFAVIKAGSNFSTVREHVDGPDWKTESVHTDITGRALMLKTLARKQELKRWGYKRVGDALSVAEAVTLAEQTGAGVGVDPVKGS
jgi:hypothetical protein